MNNEKRLLKSLDNVFGFEYNKKSSMKKLKQYFDEKRNEHVFIIEYRVVKGDKQQDKKDQTEKRKYGQYVMGQLLKDINSNI